MADPFRSSRLLYRAVRTPEDNALFDAINDDRLGYMNSNASNNKLPGSKDARTFQKQVAEDALLGAIMCLTLDEKRANEAREQIRAESEVIVSTQKKEDDESDANVEKKKTIAKQKDKDKDEKYGPAIGQITLKALPPPLSHHRSTEIAIDILPQYQGKGYGGEAIQWVLDYAFRRVGLHRVTVRAFGWNEGAIRLYQKLGFVIEGRIREALWHEGRFWDGVEMGMLEREWWEKQKSTKQA